MSEDPFDKETMTAIQLISDCLEINQVKNRIALMAMISLTLAVLKKGDRVGSRKVIEAMLSAFDDTSL